MRCRRRFTLRPPNLTAKKGTVQDITERKRAEAALKERMKELKCLYAITEIADREGCTLVEMYRAIAEVLPPSWQYPEIACAKIAVGDAEVHTENFVDTNWKQSADIRVRGTVAGKVEVAYLEEKPELDEGPFFKEERQLIDAVAERLGRITDRREAKKELVLRNRIAQIFLIVPDDDTYAEVLPVLLEATGSAYGVFGYIDEDGALVVPSMTRHVWDKCQVADKRFRFPRESWGDSSWPRCIKEKKTNYSNEPSAKTSKGHVAITRYISSPIVHRGESIGLIQVANKGTDYSEEDVRLLEAIGVFLAPVLGERLQRDRQQGERIRAEVALQKALDSLEVRVRERTAELLEAHEELEQRVQERTAELARSNAELNDFAYVASHDLKAPLRAIGNLSQWIEEDLKDLPEGETRQNMGLLRGRVQRLEALLDDLLQYARAGRVGANVASVDTAALVSDIVALLNPPGGFTVAVTGELPKFDTAKGPLAQVLRNLIGNAIKHHDRPAGRIEVSAIDRGDRYEFAVADDGPGIPPELHDKAFQMFQTLQPRDQVEGSGMGLALVKKLVQWQGGTIRMESNGDRRGTTLRFDWKKQWQTKEIETCVARR
jgi:signal transduction histidine kinase/PAS domain-containing protein